ncbi:Heterokaryon incompatibility [Apiospora sp. TS-2023a]
MANLSSLLRTAQKRLSFDQAIPREVSGDVPYATLDQAASEVRFLKLLPGRFDEAIHCNLQVGSLDSPPAYEALSYVWGDAFVTKPVYVDGHLFNATSNLEAALRHLRYRWRPRLLWVDAICINQADNGEKNYQVPLMGRIYSECSQTVAWLGLSTPEMMPVISLMSPYLTVRYWREKARQLCTDVMAYTSANNRMRRNIFYRKLALATILVSQFSYWSRIWTYQEFWLPKKVTIMCGNMLFEPLLRSTRRDAQMIIRNAYFVPERPSNANASLSEEWDQLDKVMEKQNLEHGLQYGFMLELYSASPPTTETAFALLLLNTTGRQCTNPRDRVYGLYALSRCLYGSDEGRRLQEIYPVDYDKPASVVMHETTAAGIQETGMVLFAGFSLHGGRPVGAPSVPSWVLDFNQPFTFPTKIPMLFVPEIENPDDACTEPRASIPHRSTLCLPAHRMGTCLAGPLQLTHDHTILSKTLSHLLEQTDEVHLRYRVALSSFLDVDRINRNPLILEDMLQHFSQPKPHNRYLGRDWGITPATFENLILRPLAGKSVALFCAEALSDEEQGAASIACIISGSASEGDLLVLPACDGPVLALRRELLRPEAEIPGSDAPNFSMVGVAWVEGMSGTKEADMTEDGKRLVTATRSAKHADFPIH